jgi:hypothetical protein
VQLLIFESYRDLIRLTAQGLSEGQGLKAARDENIEIRAQARVIATAAFRMQSHMAVASDVAAVTAGGYATSLLTWSLRPGIHACMHRACNLQQSCLLRVTHI